MGEGAAPLGEGARPLCLRPIPRRLAINVSLGAKPYSFDAMAFLHRKTYGACPALFFFLGGIMYGGIDDRGLVRGLRLAKVRFCIKI